MAVLLAFVPAREKRARSAAAYCMAATGFTLMALQIFLLLAFQSVYGYVYHQLAILIAMCMAGIAFGSWLGIRRIRSSDSPPYRTIATTQFLLALSGPALIFVVSLLSKISGMAATWLAAQFVFPALAALCGMLGGYQFPIATEIYLQRPQRSIKTGHTLCHRSAGRMRGRAFVEQLPHPGVWFLENRMAQCGGKPGAGAPGRAGKPGGKDVSGVSACGLFSPNTTAVNMKMSVFSSFQQPERIPALAQVSSRNLCRSHLSSTGTCGSKRPSYAPFFISKPCWPTLICRMSSTRRRGDSTETS